MFTSSMLERQYYFDEGLGESLSKHVSGLKNQYPGINIKTRRDKDGFAIVHLNVKPTFKYSLDEVRSIDPK